MNRLKYLLFSLFFVNLSLAATLNGPAPDFSLLGHDGKTHALKDFKGKLVVLEWFNHGCPFVRKHYDSENMQKLQEKYKDKGVVWLTVISSAPNRQGYIESAKAAKKRMAKEQSNADYLLLDANGQVGKEYQAKVTPHMFIVNKKGNLVYDGAIDSIASTSESDIPEAQNYVSLALDELLAAKDVSKARTTPYGCSVKY